MKRKIIKTILSCGLCFAMLLSGFSVDVSGEPPSDRVQIDAYLKNNNIVIDVKPIGNNGKTMNKTQIWGNYGKGWFLIKDYTEGHQDKHSFVWNLKTLDLKNESYYWDEETQSHAYTFEDTDLFRIYVKYKKDFSQNEKKDNTVEFYKRFYLGDIKQDVQLTTSEELSQYAPVSYDFPVVVTQGEKVELYLETEKKPETYSIKIVGDNSYTHEVTIAGDASADDGYNATRDETNKRSYIWIPEKTGTFYISVFDSREELVLQRKVHVNSRNNKYLQLDDLSIETENDIVYVRLKVADTRPSDFSGNINEQLKFVISEPHVWSRTIKNYGDTITYNTDKGTYDINENDDNFTFGSGNYYVKASIKSPHSIEPEDIIGKSYSKNTINTDDFEMSMKLISGKKNNDGSYSQKGKNPITFAFEVDGSQENCEYAFFLLDARGKRMVKEYSDDKEFYWSPADPGKYRIYARVRQKGTNTNLPNSYEKEVYTEIWIQHPDNPIQVKEVEINGNVWRVENRNATLIKTGESIKAHALNIINIDADIKGNKAKSSLMYKVVYNMKGYLSPVSPYTFSNHIPFYPKSDGKCRLIVLVKNSISGSWEDYCEIFIDIQK